MPSYLNHLKNDFIFGATQIFFLKKLKKPCQIKKIVNQ
jgi:hypothetical protein